MVERLILKIGIFKCKKLYALLDGGAYNIVIFVKIHE